MTQIDKLEKMKTISQLIVGSIISFTVIFISVFSIQNITLIRVRILWLESVNFPTGVFLAMILALGLMIGFILPSFLSSQKNSKKYQKKSFKKSSNKTNFNRDIQEENDPLFDWE